MNQSKIRTELFTRIFRYWNDQWFWMYTTFGRAWFWTGPRIGPMFGFTWYQKRTLELHSWNLQSQVIRKLDLNLSLCPTESDIQPKYWVLLIISQSTFWRLRLEKIWNFEKLWNRYQDREFLNFLIELNWVEGDYIEYKTLIL